MPARWWLGQRPSPRIIPNIRIFERCVTVGSCCYAIGVSGCDGFMAFLILIGSECCLPRYRAFDRLVLTGYIKLVVWWFIPVLMQVPWTDFAQLPTSWYARHNVKAG